MINLKKENRVTWVDCLKFIAIFFIFIGHQSGVAGRFYLFAFSFHVSLFFMISGFFANKKDIPFTEFIMKNVKRLLIPFVLFTTIVTIFTGLVENESLYIILSNTFNNFKGIRNHLTTGGGLWFIICLFWVVIFYEVLRRLLKKVKFGEYIILLISFISSILINKFGNVPSLVFNIDSALIYIFYYSLGAILFPIINKTNSLLKEPQNNNNMVKCIILKYGVLILFVVSTAITIMQFFGYSLFSLLNLGFILNQFISAIQTLLICIFFIFLSFFLQNIKLLCDIGKNTLILCCLECVINYYYIFVASVLGLWQNNMAIACMHIFLMLVIAHFTVVKLINTHFPIFCGKSRNKNVTLEQKNQG